jgi:hypothetical protein
MATKKPKASKGEATERAEASPAEAKLIRIRDRYKVMTEADESNRRLALEDLKFANEPGAQWEANMKKRRGSRPCYEFNKCRINGKRVINEIRANRPSVKVRAVEGGDKQAAELREGLIRNVFNTSDFDTVTDQAAEYQVDAGMAAWRIVTEYSSDTAFDQDIKIKPFKNPFCVYADPSCQDVLKRDAEDWIITERIAKSAYESRWPDAEVVQFEDSVEFDDEDDWEDENSVRICEYWYKEPFDKLIWLVRTPKGPLTVDMTSDEAQGVKAKVKAGEYELLKERTVRAHRIKMCIASGDAILEEADWAGTEFPFVMIYGEYKVIDGKSVWWGLHRFAKDAQRSYNVSRTAIDETIALAPKAKFWASPVMAKGNTGQWAQAHDENLPALIANPDPQFPGMFPQHMPGADVPVALMQQSIVAAQDLRDVTGLHEASFGEESSEKSGVALARKQNQAQIVTYNFPDNIAKGVLRTGEILLDLFPHIYDAEREMRILGADGTEDYIKVNELVQDVDAQGMPTMVRVNDMAAGKYDITVKTGPNFATQRQEAAEIYAQLFPPESPQYPFVADLIAKNLDYPGSDDLAERLLMAAPPAVQQKMAEGKDLPPEVIAAQAQIQQAQAMLDQQTQLVQAAAQEVQTDKAGSDVAKANVEKAIANLKVAEAQLKTAEAQFEAKVAKAMAALQAKESSIDIKSTAAQGKETELGYREERVKATETGVNEIDGLKEAIKALDGFVAQFMEAQHESVQQITAEQQKPKPKMRKARIRREGGTLIAEREMDDGSVNAIRAERAKDGSLTAVPVQ